MKENNMENKKLMSCFVTGVDITSDSIFLQTSSRTEFYIAKSNKVAVDSFTEWFNNSYVKCIPQTLTLIDYSIKMDDGVSICEVNKIVSYTNKNS